MTAMSTKDAQRFTPVWRKEPDAPVYLVRAGSVIERAGIEAELAGDYRAGRVFAFELLAAFSGGVRHLLADDPGRDQLIALAEAEANGADDLAAEDVAMLKEAREIVAEHWPEYRALTAKMARRAETAPILAFRRFCVGWENVDVPFARGPDGLISMAVLAKVDPLEMMSAGNRAYGMLYGAADEGNSGQPSPSDDGRSTSSSDAPSTAAGRSPAKGGRRTRG